MTIERYQEVYLTLDRPDKQLRKRDVAGLIDHVPLQQVGRAVQAWQSSMLLGNQLTWSLSLFQRLPPLAPISCRLSIQP